MSELRCVWEYRVPTENQKKFLEFYGEEGKWVRLFEKAKGFVGTTLMRDADDPERFLTIDAWSSREAYSAFRDQFSSEYAALDREGGLLTTSEKEIGQFVS